MQRPETIDLRKYIYNILLQNGPMSLNGLSEITGCDKEKIYYAVESAFPFEAMFRKTVNSNTIIYEAVPIEDDYGGENYY